MSFLLQQCCPHGQAGQEAHDNLQSVKSKTACVSILTCPITLSHKVPKMQEDRTILPREVLPSLRTQRTKDSFRNLLDAPTPTVNISFLDNVHEGPVVHRWSSSWQSTLENRGPFHHYITSLYGKFSQLAKKTKRLRNANLVCMPQAV